MNRFCWESALDTLSARAPAPPDDGALARLVSGKTVLVTGAGGSIGAELCRQTAALSPARLVLLDICENGVYDLMQELQLDGVPAALLRAEIASVRDLSRLRQIVLSCRPSLILHTAAHKHVPLMEHCPQEAIKNNLIGTENMTAAALESDCARFVFISTDKAVHPAGIMGASKRLAELAVQAAHGTGSTIFTTVRFGNVLGSSGSVAPLFERQIASGGPVTVTDPRVTRYFMTIGEAARLALSAASLARGGEVFVLEMGSPVSIDALARRMIAQAGLVAGRDIEIRYTGLRPGEKLTEELCLPDERIISADGRPLRVSVGPPVERVALFALFDTLAALAAQNDAGAIRLLLHQLFPDLPAAPPE